METVSVGVFTAARKTTRVQTLVVVLWMATEVAFIVWTANQMNLVLESGKERVEQISLRMLWID